MFKAGGGASYSSVENDGLKTVIQISGYNPIIRTRVRVIKGVAPRIYFTSREYAELNDIRVKRIQQRTIKFRNTRRDILPLWRSTYEWMKNAAHKHGAPALIQ